MTETAHQASPKRRSVLAALELDTRLLGMIGAFVALALVFNVVTDGRFLTPRNVFNLTIQTVSVAIMATGMVFVIVTRHIDLSAGSLLATCSAVMAMTQTVVLPDWLGLGLGHWAIAPLAILAGPALWHADRGVPGLADRVPGHSRLHRHAGRPLGLAQRRVVPHGRTNHRPARRDLPAPRGHRWHVGRDRKLGTGAHLDGVPLTVEGGGSGESPC